MDAPTRPAGFDQVGPAPVGLGALAGLREAAMEGELNREFEFEFLLIESIPTNLLLRGHNIRLRCGSKAGPDVRAFRERTGHRSLSCNLESCLALCTGPPYVSDRDVRGETRKNSCHFALAA